MSELNLDGIESIRIVRARGNLTISGADRTSINCSVSPEIERDGGVARLSIRSNAELKVGRGVAVEVVRCDGNLEVEDLGALFSAERVGGNLRVRRIGAAVLTGTVGGNLSVETAARLDSDRVGGSLYAESIENAVRVCKVGGKLLVNRAGSVEAQTVGGKVRVDEIGGGVRIETIGGKLAADSVGGDISVATIGGHAFISNASGAVELPDVGGAVDLRGPLPAGRTWRTHSRGRAALELDPAASIMLNASAGWGRLRIYGLESAGLSWSGRNRASGNLGAARPDAERTQVSIETSNADIIVAAEGSRAEFDWRWREPNWGRIAAPFEQIAEDIGREIPGFVSAVLDATGKFVSQAGSSSSSFMRDFSGSLGRGVNEALAEIDRMLDELGDAVPHDVAEKLAARCRALSEMIRRAAEESRDQTEERRREMREKIREAAREMRDAIRAAAREARDFAGDEPAPSPPPKTGASADSSRTQPFTPQSRQDDILVILNKVKAGELEPDAAEEMIAALQEVERGVGRER